MKRRVILIVGGIVAVAVIAVGAYLFQPWRLFTTVVVDEALPPESSAGPVASETPAPAVSPPSAAAPTSTLAPTSAPTPSPPVYTDLAIGTFITHEHATTGSLRIVGQPDGSRVLAIEDLSTSDGPDLRVWLTDQPVLEGTPGWGVFDDGRWIELGALKGNVGNQVYPIPADVDLAQFRSISIWCARFAVSFGAAELQSP